MIGIYVRVSTSEQAEKGSSIEEQTERTKAYCKAMKWSCYKIYADPGLSGGTMNRPGLSSLIDDVKSRKIDKVLVYKLDRLSRSQLDTLFLIEKIFLANGADFISMSENFDTGTPFGRAMIGILAVFAQLEREQIKERMTMGKLARAKKGKNTSSVPPIGYDLIDGKLIPNDFEKIQIRELFQLYVSGFSPLQIERIFHEKGYRTKYGEWKSTTIRKILDRRTYIGESPYSGKWFPGEHEPIISKDLFDQAQIIRERKSNQFFENVHYGGEATSYLAGLLFCGNCGAKYSKESHKTTTTAGNVIQYDYYSCTSRTRKSYKPAKDLECRNRRIRMKDLDDLIFTEIKKLALDPEYVEQINDEQSDDDREKILRSELEKIENQMNKLLDLFAVDSIPDDLLQEKMTALNDQRAAISSEISRSSKNQKQSPDQIRKKAVDFSFVLGRGSFEQVRALLFGLIRKIIIFDDDIEIHWNF